MKILGFVVILLIVIVLVMVALTYPRYQREMYAAKERLIVGSQLLLTARGVLEYAVRGEGTPVLLLHGAGGGYDQGLWCGKVGFGEGYKFISVSRFGYLRTPIPENATIKAQVAWYADLLDRLNIRRVIVVGISAGGPSATQFANDYPQRCSALILWSAVSQGRAPGDKDPFYIGIIHLIQRSDYAYWLVAKFMQPMFLNLVGVPPKVYQGFSPEQKALAQEMLDEMHPMSQRYPGTMNDGVMIERDSVTVDKLVAPTLILHAKDDALVSYAHALHAHEKIKQSQLITFETGGHGLLSQMDSVREDIRRFLK